MSDLSPPLVCVQFGDDTLFHLENLKGCAIAESVAVRYLKCHLDGLQACTVVEESSYFDWDYLAQFREYYSVSARPYPNLCRRLHYFSAHFDTAQLQQAASGDQAMLTLLKESYLGFIVLRPIPYAPLGRTVLRMQEDPDPSSTLFDYTSRYYHVHLLGFTLRVRGLAWQQQDDGVASCATVAIWTSLQASVFKEFHAKPTTAEITRDATAVIKQIRAFPNQGLLYEHFYDAIKTRGLELERVNGDMVGQEQEPAFSRQFFNSICVSFLRGGNPVLLGGYRRNGRKDYHLVCIMAFRDAKPLIDQHSDPIVCHEKDVEIYYIHDDSIGPAVPFRIIEGSPANEVLASFIDLKPSMSEMVSPVEGCSIDPELIDVFHPTDIFVPVSPELRLAPEVFRKAVLWKSMAIFYALAVIGSGGIAYCRLTYSFQYERLWRYLEQTLATNLAKDSPAILGQVRWQLSTEVPPMSLNIGVARIGFYTSETQRVTPLLDILFDTTDTPLNLPVFANVQYSPVAAKAVDFLQDPALQERVVHFFASDSVQLPIDADTARKVFTFGVSIPAFAGTDVSMAQNEFPPPQN